MLDIKEISCEVTDWIHVARDRVQWLVLMNTMMNLRVSYNKTGNILLCERLSVSAEGSTLFS